MGPTVCYSCLARNFRVWKATRERPWVRSSFMRRFEGPALLSGCGPSGSPCAVDRVACAA